MFGNTGRFERLLRRAEGLPDQEEHQTGEHLLDDQSYSGKKTLKGKKKGILVKRRGTSHQ
jgi:hypothetical protein